MPANNLTRNTFNNNAQTNEYQPPFLVENKPHEIGEEAQIEAANEMNAQKAQTTANEEEYPQQNTTAIPAQAEESENLDEEAQEQAAMQLAATQQFQIRNLEKQKAAAQEDLNRLESSLNDLKNTKVFKLTQIFSGGPTVLIDRLMEFVKKDMRKMPPSAREKALTTAVALTNNLLSVLKLMQRLAAFMDAVYTDKFSVGKLITLTLPTVIIPIILIVIAPLWIIIMFIIFTLGVIPGVKGTITNQITKAMEPIIKQRDAWQKEIDTIAPKKAIRRQINQIDTQIEKIRAGKA